MKKLILNFIVLLVVALCFAACSKDNFDEPNVKVYGSVTYNDKALNLRGTAGAVQLQLYQDGYALHNPIAVNVGQDGKFSAEVFSGSYKLITTNGNGPWVNARDSIAVKVNGDTEVNVKVTPYYLISNGAVTYSSGVITGTGTIQKIVSTAEIDYVQVILSKTQFVDDANNVYSFKSDDSFDNNALTVDLANGKLSLDLNKAGKSSTITAINACKYLYGRIAVRTKGADQSIYSEVIKLK